MPPNTNTEIALLKQAMDFQNNQIAEIKKILLEFIDSANDKFATKEENGLNQKRLDAHDAIISRITWSIIGGFVTIILALV
jgi:hypothetical protein